MAEAEFIVQGLERFQRTDRRFQAAFRQAGRELMLRSLSLLQREVQVRTPVNVGRLRASIGFIAPRIAGNRVEGKLATNVIYALPIEHGTKPHWPPRAPIEFWVARKLGVRGKKVRSVAFLVARKIARRGTPAQRMFEEGLNASSARIREIFNRLPGLIRERMR